MLTVGNAARVDGDRMGWRAPAQSPDLCRGSPAAGGAEGFRDRVDHHRELPNGAVSASLVGGLSIEELRCRRGQPSDQGNSTATSATASSTAAAGWPLPVVASAITTSDPLRRDT